MFLNIVDDVEEFMKPVQQFINNNYSNPIFWIAIVVIVLGVFALAHLNIHRK